MDILDQDASVSSEDVAAVEALKEAIQMAWTKDPIERSSARALSNHLYAAIKALVENLKDGDVVRVFEVPPLPPNHRYSDSDFRKYRKPPM
jgi:hypothetical protein